MAQNKNYAKRVPTAAVFTITGQDDNTNAGESFGVIEGNIAITRLSFVIVEPFGPGAEIAQLTSLTSGATKNWITVAIPADTPAGTTTIADDFDPTATGATVAPVYNPGKSLWDINLSTAGSTAGVLKVVVEYVQLDTEPGLHSATNV